MDWLSLAKLLAPMLLAQTPFGKSHPSLIPVVSSGILVGEQIFGAKTGTEKLAHVLSGVEVGMAAVNAVTGKGEPDPVVVKEQVTAAVGDVIKTINLFRDANAKDPLPTPAE